MAPQTTHRRDRDEGGTDELLIKVSDGARRLAVSRRTLCRLIAAGVIPVRRIGRSVRFDPIELQRWVEQGCPGASGRGDEGGAR